MPLILQVSISEAMRPQGDATFIMAGEERVFAIYGYRAYQVFDLVGVDLHAVVGQEPSPANRLPHSPVWPRSRTTVEHFAGNGPSLEVAVLCGT